MSHTTTILIVDDEPLINDSVAARLRAEGFAVCQAGDGPSAVATFTAQRPDLVILDIMLPGFDGLEVCRRIQAERAVPVLMLTARDDETDLLVGLGVGADDYMTKPFSMRELVARVSALLRRVSRAAELAQADPPTIVVGDLSIAPSSRRVTLSDNEIRLTPLEFDLLHALAERPDVVRTREELMREVWGWASATGTRTLDSHVKSLRAKLGPDRIRTIHGVGYAVDQPANPGQPSNTEQPTAQDRS